MTKPVCDEDANILGQTISYKDKLKHSLSPVLVWLILVSPLALLERLTAFQWSDWRFQREQILAGEWWRCLTGHLDHLGWAHWSLNAVFLALCLSLFSPLQRLLPALMAWLFAAILISLAILLISPNMVWYVGLSSSLYALLVYGVLLDKRYKLGLRLVVVTVVLMKVIWGQNSESTWVANFISGPVSELSHLYGAIVGVAMAFCVLGFDRTFRLKAD